MKVYLASDRPLPLVPWDEAHPGFNVTNLSNWWEDWVRQQFTKPFVYNMGSYQGCACGFQFEGESLGDHPDDVAARESSRQFAEFLATALDHQAEIELFACWDGDQAAAPERRRRFSLVDLTGNFLVDRESQFLIVGHPVRSS